MYASKVSIASPSDVSMPISSTGSTSSTRPTITRPTPISNISPISQPASITTVVNPRTTSTSTSTPPRVVTTLGNDIGVIRPSTQQSNPYQAPPRTMSPTSDVLNEVRPISTTTIVTQPIPILPLVTPIAQPSVAIPSGGGGAMGGGGGSAPSEEGEPTQATQEEPKSNKSLWVILAIVGGVYLLSR
jgi:hypothetical protein